MTMHDPYPRYSDIADALLCHIFEHGGRGETILLERERIKQNTINQRRLQHRKTAA